MFISKLGGSERKGNHLLTPKRRFKSPKTHDLITCLTSKPVPVAFIFPLLLADLEKKYKNESEFDRE